jgi:uncharacterized membrane protein YjfL (UPF0719 family)
MRTIIFSQVLVAFLAGIASLFILYRIVNSILKKRFLIEEANHAFAIFQAGILISGALILSSVMDPAINAIQFLSRGGIDMQDLLLSMAYVLVFLLIGLSFTILVIFSGVFAFFQMTNINEWEEIKNNNIPTAIISAALIIGLSLIMNDHVGHLCEGLIPYPEVLQIP